MNVSMGLRRVSLVIHWLLAAVTVVVVWLAVSRPNVDTRDQLFVAGLATLGFLLTPARKNLMDWAHPFRSAIVAWVYAANLAFATMHAAFTPRSDYSYLMREVGPLGIILPCYAVAVVVYLVIRGLSGAAGYVAGGFRQKT